MYNYKTKTCSNCNKVRLIVNSGKNLCMYCNRARLLKKSIEKNKIKIATYNKLSKFYKEFWNLNTKHVCFETQAPLHSFKKWHVHHVLEKKNYPELMYNKDVCVLLTLEQHSLWHSLPNDFMKMHRMPKTYNKLLTLLKKYLMIDIKNATGYVEMLSIPVDGELFEQIGVSDALHAVKMAAKDTRDAVLNELKSHFESTNNTDAVEFINSLITKYKTNGTKRK